MYERTNVYMKTATAHNIVELMAEVNVSRAYLFLAAARCPNLTLCTHAQALAATTHGRHIYTRIVWGYVGNGAANSKHARAYVALFQHTDSVPVWEVLRKAEARRLMEYGRVYTHAHAANGHIYSQRMGHAGVDRHWNGAHAFCIEASNNRNKDGTQQLSTIHWYLAHKPNTHEPSLPQSVLS